MNTKVNNHLEEKYCFYRLSSIGLFIDTEGKFYCILQNGLPDCDNIVFNSISQYRQFTDITPDITVNDKRKIALVKRKLKHRNKTG